jgi:3-(3-hydroxy-phenyl)propionate hydroxylase
MDMQVERASVVVVGYGPVGGAVANLLAREGVDVAIVEAFPGIYPLPRAGGMVAESLRAFQMLGLAEELVPGMLEFTFWYDIFDKDWNRVVERKPDLGPSFQGWGHNYMFFQPDFERALRAANDRLGVRAFLGERVTSIRQGSDGVDLVLESGDGGSTGLHADWVVGCDGSRSIVRDAIGCEQEDFGGDEPWLLVHLRVTREGVELPDRIFEWANPDRAVSYITPFPKDLKLFEFRVVPGETAEELTDHARVWELLSPWLSPGDAELVRTVVYEFHSRVAERWRNGRLLIAGDAAHEMPPTLGEGLNSGFRDAMNLAWKLAGVSNGTLRESILDSYELERRPHVRGLVELSNALARATALVSDDPDSYRTNLRLDSVWAHPRPTMNPGLHGDVDAPVGTLAEQPRLATGELLDDVLGYRLAVIGDSALLEAANVATGTVWRQWRTIVVTDEDPAVRAWLQRVGSKAVVVRPDRYIFGVADTVGDLDAVAAKLGPYLVDQPAPVHEPS